ncbi:MAG: hypothetical protein Kow00108_25060 [Calditrichia bacterium]
MMAESQWIKIAVFDNEYSALMAKQVLEDEHIPHLLKKDSLSTLYGLGGSLVGHSFHLFTTELYIDKAIELIRMTGGEAFLL